MMRLTSFIVRHAADAADAAEVIASGINIYRLARLIIAVVIGEVFEPVLLVLLSKILRLL